MKKFLNLFLSFMLLFLMVSCTSSHQKNVSKEICYVGQNLYYTVSHSYQNDLLIKSTLDYEDSTDEDVYEYKYDKSGNKAEEKVYSNNKLTYTLTFEYENGLCIKEEKTFEDAENNYTIVYEYKDKLKSKMIYFDASGNEYYYCDYDYNDNEDLIEENK